jgi:hypothetical protein
VNLNDAERRALAEIESRLAGEDPHLVLFPQQRGGWTRLPVIPVVLAMLVFLVAIGLLAVWVGDVIPVLLALPVAGAVAALLRSQRRAGDAPVAAPPPTRS